MKNLLSGLEKFGIDEKVAMNLFKESDEHAEIDGQEKTAAPVIPTEEEFLLKKTIKCPICDHNFHSLSVKAGRIKRLDPDLDLRPKFQYIDTNKYDVSSCPFCGYTSLNRYFSHVSSLQTRLIKEGVMSKFKASCVVDTEEVVSLSYDEAIEKYKLALYNTLVKKGGTSEKAYICLKVAWLYRGKAEELANDDLEQNKAVILECKKEELQFYEQALEGLMKAMTEEDYPICGMDSNTLDLLIAAMAFNLEKYDVSAKFVSSLLISRTASRTIKDRAHDLKEKIIEKRK